MLRLAHQILLQRHHVVLMPAGFDYQESESNMLDVVQMGARISSTHLKAACPIVIADNVSDYCYSFSDEKAWDFKEDIPNLTPPWESFFIEWKLPAMYCAPESPTKFSRQGWMFVSCKPKKPEAADVAWHLLCTHWLLTTTGYVVYPGEFALIEVSREGRFLGWRLVSKQTNHGRSDISALNLHIPFLTISFLHCKNVTLHDVTATEGPPRKNLRRMKLPELRYRTVNIEPMKQVLRSDGDTEHSGLKKGLHICRGHFRTYSEDGPGMFGNGLCGTVFIPSHTRGSLEHGRIVSTYNVKAPCNS